ncbi:TetR/AcrR family transcriptional regulator [Paenibacillus sp. NFR01]|uniref:TetR/AcrR family transcriptional regulator n=1 Tax=Paenibacillus sp. NFR01 TaxID=1566279 RepID=UPI0008C7E4C9|nr:TetR/AcrR family transcriptional regulator [Paenibacillus sp. NFR01]SET28791.1 transcriptional regulator, TetR family [Paenibacillus sp. NFR01]
MSPRAGLDELTIVEAAAQLADEQGIQAVTLAALAARLGVRPPSLYNHIASLDALRSLIAIHGLAELGAELAAASRDKRGEAAVIAMSKAYLAYAKRRPGVYETTLRAPESGNAAMEAASSRILALIIGVLADYELGAVGELHAVRGLRSLMHGFASLEAAGAFGMPLETADSYSRLIHAFITGIGCMKDEAERQV